MAYRDSDYLYPIDQDALELHMAVRDAEVKLNDSLGLSHEDRLASKAWEFENILIGFLASERQELVALNVYRSFGYQVDPTREVF